MIGIVVLNYNTPLESVECIHSIMERTSVPFEIIVVDNCSTDNSVEILQAEFSRTSNVRVVISNGNYGYSNGNNLGLRNCNDEVDAFLIINSDVTLLNGAIDVMYRTLKRGTKMAVIGPSVVNLSGEESQCMRRRLMFKDFVFEKWPLVLFGIDTGRWIRWQQSGSNSFKGMVSGCCFMIDAEVFQECGFFDDSVFLYGEEDILAHKLHVLGYEAGISIDAKVLHKHSQSVSKRGAAFRRLYSLTSPLYVLRAYHGIRGIKFAVASVIAILPYFLYSVFSKQYRGYFKKFLTEYLRILKTKGRI